MDLGEQKEATQNNLNPPPGSGLGLSTFAYVVPLASRLACLPLRGCSARHFRSLGASDLPTGEPVSQAQQERERHRRRLDNKNACYPRWCNWAYIIPGVHPRVAYTRVTHEEQLRAACCSFRRFFSHCATAVFLRPPSLLPRWSTQQSQPQNSQPLDVDRQRRENQVGSQTAEQSSAQLPKMTDQREQQPHTQQPQSQQQQQQQQTKGNEEPRTNLIINYLPQSMTEKDLYSLFVTIGPVESCRVMKDYKTGYSYGFGFVNYAKAEDAATAINTLNGLQVQNKRLKVSFARPSGEEIKETNLYVTNLPRNITESQIDDIFSKYGNIVQKNILKDKLTGLPRGVAFVRFDKREEAQEAIARLHGTIPEGGSEPLSVKIAEEHGKQKAAYYAGWQAGYNQSRGAGSGGLGGGGRGRGISGPPGMNMGISGGGPGMLGRASGFGPRGGPHGGFLGGSGGPGAMRMEKIHPHRFNPIGMGGGYVQSHFW